ncbi:CBS domain [Dillenia turbinata]|uniref:CBS domain n=1 Tax=Dillenia turbinata TaxID=194707 RepID=A0AAN8ZIS5_9MAGN
MKAEKQPWVVWLVEEAMEAERPHGVELVNEMVMLAEKCLLFGLVLGMVMMVVQFGLWQAYELVLVADIQFGVGLKPEVVLVVGTRFLVPEMVMGVETRFLVLELGQAAPVLDLEDEIEAFEPELWQLSGYPTLNEMDRNKDAKNSPSSAILQRIPQACNFTVQGKGGPVRRFAISHDGGATPPPAIQHKGLGNTTVADVVMTKGDNTVGSWLWCRTKDTVYDAVKNMAENNVGSLAVLKPGCPKLIAGIVTEQEQVTVPSDANLLHAMQLMTNNHIQHVPLVDGRMIVSMISIVDVIRAVVD